MSVVCLGELLIDFVSLESGVGVGDASGFEKKPGGAPANVAVAVQKLGHPCAFMTQVGDDPFGRYLAGVL
ncbi:MAG: PfkB family carbohydrate kinase, partial [Chloroflexota bacterium]